MYHKHYSAIFFFRVKPSLFVIDNHCLKQMLHCMPLRDIITLLKIIYNDINMKEKNY